MEGPRSTWREYTRKESDVWDGLERMGHGDLGVHLHDGFVLKGGAKAATEDEVGWPAPSSTGSISR